MLRVDISDRTHCRVRNEEPADEVNFIKLRSRLSTDGLEQNHQMAFV